MARRSQCSSAGDNPLDPNYLPPHYREEYRLAIDALVEKDVDGYYDFLQKADVVDFLAGSEIHYIQNSVQTPNQSSQPEQYFVESDGDGSSDTYWPVHSDLEVPGLDLGWPHTHSFIEPTEITTLVNPPEPDMPSIKDQARRLIKNAQQVIAIVMDMFTDVDVFADILNAASRRVAVYILLDEHNAQHFINMVLNCRVNLQNFQFLRVRTVSGITYQCRSGKTFKGQMMDRFLLTDCRAVLSGNYSFMWSFEKLHRCMAHLFLGQLVTNFDEEFRILFAQSQPLIIENVLAPLEDFNVLHKTQHPVESSVMYRDPRKFLSPDSGHPDEWARHSFDERMDGDWKMMALKKQDSLRGPADVYNRFASQQPRVEHCFDQGASRILMTENPALKRHSYAEGVQNRYSLPFMQQQGMPESELKGKPLYRSLQPYPGPGPEADYSAYDKFWNRDYLTDPYFEPGAPQEVPPIDNFDPVLNYLSSTRNPDFDQSSDKFLPASHPKRLDLGQPYVCQTSPTPSNSADQKHVFQHPTTTNRKDPTVKQGLRNWRISSFLSAYENPEEEGLPLDPAQSADAFEDPPNPIQQSAPGMGLLVPKIPNVKEFKVPATPRASQIPNYAKATVQEKPKKLPNEPVPVAVELKTTPSEISTNEGEKTEEAEQKEPKSSVLRRDDSFRRKYNAAMQRSSRLRSSLIYHSLDQQQTPQDTTTAEQHDEESDKDKTEQAKLPFVSHVLGQRKPATREPFEWSRYIKSAFETRRSDDVNDKDPSKEDNSKDLLESVAAKEQLKPSDVEQETPSTSAPQSELSKTDQLSQSAQSLLTSSLYEDMSDHDKRFLFFKELAAKRKAEKEKEKPKMKPETDLKTSSTIQKEEPLPKITSGRRKSMISEGLNIKGPAAEGAGKVVSPEACESASVSLDESENANKKDSVTKNVSDTFGQQETKLSAGLEKPKLNTQSRLGLAGSAETDGQTRSLVEPAESSLFRKDLRSPSMPRSKPSEAELPKTDQPVQPFKPFTTRPLYVDMSDPDNRLMFFKELAAKRKAAEAAEAKKEKERVPIKPQVKLPNSSTTPPLKTTSEDVKTSRPEGLVLNAAEEKVEKTVTTEARESASLLLDNRDSTNMKDSVVNQDSKTCSEQEIKTATFAKRDSPEEPAVPNPFVEEGSNFPQHKNDSPAVVSSVTDERESLPLDTTSKELTSVTPISEESTPSPALVTNTQNLESAQLEYSVYSPEPHSRSEISSPNSLVRSSSSDHSLPISGPQNSPLIAEDLSSSSGSPEVPNILPQSDDGARALDFITPSQESTPSANETLQKSNNLSSQTHHLDSVPQSEVSKNVESDICPGLEPSSEECSAATPSAEGEGSEKAVSQLETGESIAEECKSPEVDSKFPTISPSVPESSRGVSDMESSVSKHDLKENVTSADPPSKHMALEAESVGNADFDPAASLSEASTTPQSIPTQAALTTLPTQTDVGAPTPTGAELSSRLSEPDQSVLTPETKKTDPLLSVVDTVSISSTSQAKAEVSPVHQSAPSLSSSSEFTSETPAQPDLPCKTSETEKPSKSQTEPTVPEEIDEKEPEVVDTDKKTPDNPEDTCKSENVGALELRTSEDANDPTNLKNSSESAEVSSKQPKSTPSRYHSSTANVLSSSNLRDDTKLLLEQISANCQSRNEATKESPVTDDEKEDKADKNGKKDRGFRTLIRGQPKPTQDREKLLERIQSMRKEKKIYSRFELSS